MDLGRTCLASNTCRQVFASLHLPISVVVEIWDGKGKKAKPHRTPAHTLSPDGEKKKKTKNAWLID